MRRLCNRLSIGAACTVLAMSGSASAQVDIERFEPALDADGFLGVQSTRTPGAGRTSYALFLHYSSALLEIDTEASGTTVLVQDRSSAALSAQGGIGERFALGFSLPLVLYQEGEVLRAADDALPAFAVGDPRAHVRYRFVGDKGEKRDGPGVALQLSAALPAGDDEGYAGEGSTRLSAQLLGDFHLLGAGIGGSVGLRHRFSPRTLFDVTLRDEMTFGVGLRMPIPPLFPLTGVVELRGATDFASSKATALEGELGLLYRTGEVTLMVAAGAGFSGGIGTPGARVIAGFWYAPAESDTDGDGIADEDDQCPPLPEDRDGYQDADGCPDPDNDNDLVPDMDDLCPNDEALEGRDDDEDGCTDK